jgi:uncharacterized protein YutE (UPF0331/DUF86 family)
MTYLVERLAELRRHLEHLEHLRPRVTRQMLVDDLSLHNDVLYSLLIVCQLVIDIAGELSAQRREPFDDYTQAIRNLSHDPRFSPDLVERLAQLPGFRNVVIHEYIQIDFDRVVEAVNSLGPIEEFIAILRSAMDMP